jgi:hypothetical protein
MTGRRGNFVIVLVVVVVLGLLGRKVIEHDDEDDDDNEKTVKRVKEWGRQKDENENEHEDEYDLGTEVYPLSFAQWLARIPLVKSWNG